HSRSTAVGDGGVSPLTAVGDGGVPPLAAVGDGGALPLAAVGDGGALPLAAVGDGGVSPLTTVGDGGVSVDGAAHRRAPLQVQFAIPVRGRSSSVAEEFLLPWSRGTRLARC